MTRLPCRALINILKPALTPCPQLRGSCAHACVWQPEHGYMPRGFIGATGTAAEVRLVLITAGPGDPADGERYLGPPAKRLQSHIDFIERALAGNPLRRQGWPSPFFPNLKKLLDLCWPGLSLREQLRLTWITNTVKCSIPAPSPEIEAACITRYLKREIEALPHAFVLALGAKARDRLEQAGIRADSTAYHPCAYDKAKQRETWEAAVREFHAWLAAQRE